MVGQWFPKLARLEHDGTWAHFPFHHLAEFYADYGTYDVTLDVPEAYHPGRDGSRWWSRAWPTDGASSATFRPTCTTSPGPRGTPGRSRARPSTASTVTLLYPRGFTSVAQRELATLRFGLPYYSAHYGRYPYEVLTVVHPQEDAGESGGMEYPTFITSGGSWMTPPRAAGARRS